MPVVIARKIAARKIASPSERNSGRPRHVQSRKKHARIRPVVDRPTLEIRRSLAAPLLPSASNSSSREGGSISDLTEGVRRSWGLDAPSMIRVFEAVAVAASVLWAVDGFARRPIKKARAPAQAHITPLGRGARLVLTQDNFLLDPRVTPPLTGFQRVQSQISTQLHLDPAAEAALAQATEYNKSPLVTPVGFTLLRF